MSRFDWQIIGIDGATRLHASTIETLANASGIGVLDLYALEEKRSLMKHGDYIGCRVMRVLRTPTKTEAKRVLMTESPCHGCKSLKDSGVCSKNWLTCVEFSEWVGNSLSAFRTLHGCEEVTR